MAKYNCKTCGAELYFDPKTGKLSCEYCGSTFDPSEYNFTEEDAKAKAEQQAVPAEEVLTEGTESTDDSTGDLVVYKCPHCGAEVITAKDTVVTTCVYCNRAITMEGNIQGAFRPDYVLPFIKTREDVEKSYMSLCKSSPLTPTLFTRKSTIEKIKGMYIPFWLYSFDGDANLEIEGRKTRHWTTGDMEYTEVSRYKVDEEAKGSFENIPADALKEMDNDLMDSIEPFDFSKLKEFNSAYLAGFYTQKWDEDSAMNEHRAKNRAKAAMTSAIMTNLGGRFDSTTISHEQFRWKNEKAKYAMIPVWMMYTEYKGKKYIFGMNGQTGKMMGDIPKDPMKIAKYAGAVFVASQLVMMIIRILGVM